MVGRLALVVLDAMSKQNTIKINKELSTLITEYKEPENQAFFTALQAIIDGSRDLELADNPIFHYQQVVELKILLTALM